MNTSSRTIGRRHGSGHFGPVSPKTASRGNSVSRRNPYDTRQLPRPHQNMANKNHKSFVLMDITVSVLTLNGILMSSKSKKEKRQSDASLRYAGSGDLEGGFPVNAVVSFSKNVTSSQTSIASHFPSLPLQHSVQHSNTDKQRLIASWPKDYDSEGNKLCTFQFSRMMRKESISPDSYDSSQKSSVFVPERVRLIVGLTRGSEIINIGSSTLVVMGGESGSVQMNLPVNFDKNISNDDEKAGIGLSRTSSTFFSSRKKGTRNMKPAFFTNDPNRKYSLDQNACLKVVVTAVPSESRMNVNNASGPQAQPVMQFSESASAHLSKSWDERYESRDDSGADLRSPSRSNSRSNSRSMSESNSRSSSQSNNRSTSQNNSRISNQVNNRGNSRSNSRSNSKSTHRSNSKTTDKSRSAYCDPPHLQSYYFDEPKENCFDLSRTYDDKSCSSISDGEDEHYYTKPLAFCGGLCNLMNIDSPQKSNNRAKKNLQKLKKRASRRSSITSRAYDLDSVMPTHKNNDDNESQFIPPSKVYAKSFSEEDDVSRDGLTQFSLADTIYSDEEESAFGQSRHGNHSVITEKFTNKTSDFKKLQETRNECANRMGVNPTTLI